MPKVFAKRRNQLLAALPGLCMVLLKAAPSRMRNGDNHYPYRQQSDFYYLSGLDEPESIMALTPGSPEGEFILFVREKDFLREQWEGPFLGLEGARDRLGADKAYPIAEFQQRLEGLLTNKESVYYLFEDNCLGSSIHQALLNLKKKVRSGVQTPSKLQDLSNLLHEMRLFKDQDEIELMRQAATLSAKAHQAAMSSCRVGMKEYELQAVLEYELKRHGCRDLAYPSIVAGGANACILHYTENSAELKNGDLVLVDAGGEYQNYAADITRTYPVNGRFSVEQRAIYELVLHVQETVIASIKPGVRRDLMQELSEQEITRGLMELGILQGTLEELLRARAFTPFYMHRIGHWLGLDVHDVGAYKINDEWRTLEPGMVLTIEPGIYITPGMQQVDACWWGIGVRIEDDVLVTSTACEVLSASVPKSVVEIEKIMS